MEVVPCECPAAFSALGFPPAASVGETSFGSTVERFLEVVLLPGHEGRMGDGVRLI